MKKAHLLSKELGLTNTYSHDELSCLIKSISSNASSDEDILNDLQLIDQLLTLQRIRKLGRKKTSRSNKTEYHDQILELISKRSTNRQTTQIPKGSPGHFAILQLNTSNTRSRQLTYTELESHYKHYNFSRKQYQQIKKKPSGFYFKSGNYLMYKY